MCGISGCIARVSLPVEPAVRKMMRAMTHRGPDDEGYEQLPLGNDGGPIAGFGFRRLSIMDLSQAGHQPMRHPTTGDCLIFNGEIYNFRDVRRELESEGVTFLGSSDTEVLLHALAVWGESALQRIEGMYAFAFFESRSRRILLARDPLGIKPLYIARLSDRLLFASEIQALLASGLVPDDLDTAGIAGMLAYGAVQHPRTIHRCIRSFPAGEYQWIDGRVTEGHSPATPTAFWSFPQTSIDDDSESAAECVRSLLRDSVLRHLVADVPVGVFLSAGIDSTVIASFAREFTPRVTAFTVGFGAVHGEDEVALAAATAEAIGVSHISVELDAANMPGKWQDWLQSMDSPSIDGFNTFVVSRRLAAEGVVVGLSGLGADEIFGGYDTFTRAPAWSRLLGSLTFFPEWLRSGAIAGVGRINGRIGAAEKLADLVSGDPSVAGVARSLRRDLSNRRLTAFGMAHGRVGLGADFLDPENSVTPMADPFNTVSRIETTHYMRDTLLRDTDANSMRHSLEVRVPFLHRPLVDYMSSLRGDVKQSRGQSKSLLRAAAAKELPSTIARRPKTGFTLPIDDWMRGQMRDSCEAAIEAVTSLPFLEPNAVRGVWQDFLGNRRSLHYSRPLALIVLGNAIQQGSRMSNTDLI
jgi:asparagine synthase (glutamine-hydrolysing)